MTRTPITTTAIAIAAAANLAAADVTYSAESVHGVGTVVRDDTNNLEFLRLSPNTNISYDDMVANHLSTGGQYEGWRYASRDDIDALFESAGIQYDSGSRISPASTVRSLSLAFGITFTFPDGEMARGIFEISPGNIRTFEFGEAYDFDKFEDIGYYYVNTIAQDEASEFAGHYLVRAVPAPGSAALLALGTLAATRRRR